jgi:hypothetical protein
MQIAEAVVATWQAIDVALSPTIQTFYQLLSSLIGPSLTERLLRSVWSDTHYAVRLKIF